MLKERLVKEKQELIKDKEHIKETFREGKKDKRIFALLFVEFLISIAIALSIYFYLDPETNVVPFPLSVLVFGVLMFLLAVVFHKTKEFRDERNRKN
jgi:sodium--glutamate symport carrier gltS